MRCFWGSSHLHKFTILGNLHNLNLLGILDHFGKVFASSPLRLPYLLGACFVRKHPLLYGVKSIGNSLPSACPLCLKEEESKAHLFFRYAIAGQAWRWLCYTVGVVSPKQLSGNAIWSFLSAFGYSASHKIMGAAMPLLAHAIWKTRNDVAHRGLLPGVSSICDFFIDLAGPSLARSKKQFQSAALSNIFRSPTLEPP